MRTQEDAHNALEEARWAYSRTWDLLCPRRPPLEGESLIGNGVDWPDYCNQTINSLGRGNPVKLQDLRLLGQRLVEIAYELAEEA